MSNDDMIEELQSINQGIAAINNNLIGFAREGIRKISIGLIYLSILSTAALVHFW